MPVSYSSQHQSGRPFPETWSSPSTSEDESAASTAGGFSAPLLQRGGGRRLLRSSTTSTSSPTHTHSSTSSHQRHRRTGSHPFPSSFQEQGSGDLNSEMAAHSVHSTRPPLPRKQELCGAEQGVQVGAECRVEVIGLVLLHPSVAGEVGPSFTRLLGRSR